GFPERGRPGRQHPRDRQERPRGRPGRHHGGGGGQHDHGHGRPAGREQRRDRQGAQGDHLDRAADQPSGAERDHRGGPGRRGGQGFFRGGQRGGGTGQGDGQGRRRHRAAGRRRPPARAGGGRTRQTDQ